MKSVFLAVVVLIGLASGANASTHAESMYRDTIRPHGHARSDAIYNAALNVCYERSGESRNSVHDTPAFKRCMLTAGYRFLYTKVIQDPAPPVRERMAAGRSYSGPSVTISTGGGYTDEEEAAQEEENDQFAAQQAAASQDEQDAIDAADAANAAAAQQ